ncbi:MAG: hypothetical protein GY847_09535 [Proteobacteria bacterium]|nr:hypothetical protein [Pseudomonadota bacterium]
MRKPLARPSHVQVISDFIDEDMLTLSDSPKQEIIEFVKNWMKLLAENRLEEACAVIDKPNRYGLTWTPERILEMVHSTFRPGTHFHDLHPEGPIFTDPYELEEQENREVGEFADDNGYWFDFDIPLNGEWSDLTAQFEFHKRANGYTVVLHDLHVL